MEKLSQFIKCFHSYKCLHLGHFLFYQQYSVIKIALLFDTGNHLEKDEFLCVLLLIKKFGEAMKVLSFFYEDT